MGCTQSSETISVLKRTYSGMEFQDPSELLCYKNEGTSLKIVYLNKGGIIIESKLGNIQFGMPPETVKDC